MQRHRDTSRPLRAAVTPPVVAPDRAASAGPTHQFLAHAAASAAHAGIDLATFMEAAWSAFVEARPGLRERLEQIQLVDHLARLREEGKLGQS